jgi:P4 family phage/plasmid primase-like protien
MSDRIFADNAPRYWEAGYSPLPLNGKRPLLKNWPSYCDNLPKAEARAEWLTRYPSAGSGLALGKELVPGYRLAAIDVDDDRFVSVAEAIIGPGAPAKIGKKGKTFILLIEKAKDLKSTALRSASGSPVIDLLISDKQTVIPPSVHPEIGKPYRWVDRSLLEFGIDEIPRLVRRQVELLTAIIGSLEAEVLTSGQHTHDAGVRLAAQLVRYEENDQRLADIIAALLPAGYSGNSLAEILGWVRSAREKGFADIGSLPKDEAAARAVAEQMAPLAYSQRDGFLQYARGRWRVVPENDIFRHLKDHLLTLPKPGSMVANSVRSAAACLTLNVEDQGFGEPQGLICLRNGTLNVRTGELLDHSPDHRLLFSLDIDWDPRATCPVYEQQLAETLRQDDKAISVFEEYAGLSLVPDQRFQKAVFLMGEGGSGKSTLLRTIQMMHDPQAVSVTPLDKIEDERYRADVVGKLICISYDVQTRHRIFGETFIRVTGGDAVAVRRLFKEVDGLVQPTVRFIGSMNPDMPPYQGSPDALRRRLIFLQCGSRVANPDPDREAHIAAEKSGILVRWVAALRRLYERGRFDIPESSIAEVDEYLVAYEPFDAFATEWLTKDKGEWIPVAEVAIKFAEWAETQQDRPLPTQVVGRKLKRLGFELGQKRMSRSGESINTRVVFAKWTKSRVVVSGKF